MFEIIGNLHLHTTASDGIYTPSEIVRRAAEKGLKYIAITDHADHTNFDLK